MAIAENPQNFLAYFYLSNIYLEKRMYNEANEIIEASNRIKMSTADRDALAREGMVEITETDSLKYKEAALADYKKALQKIKEEAANLIIAVTEKIITKKIDKDDEDFIKKAINKE